MEGTSDDFSMDDSLRQWPRLVWATIEQGKDLVTMRSEYSNVAIRTFNDAGAQFWNIVDMTNVYPIAFDDDFHGVPP